MKNLLFYGTTDYGLKLSSSDSLKFKEVSRYFNPHVMTFGNLKETIEHEYVTISYIKKPKLVISKYFYFYFLNYRKFRNFCINKNIEIISAKDPIAALIPIIYKKLRNKNVKIIIEHHGNFLDLLLNQRKLNLQFLVKIVATRISKYTYKNCDFIRGVEKTFTEELSKKYNKDFHYFPAWVDYSIFKKTNIDRKNILFIGNIIPRKGVDFIIENFNNFCVNNKFNEKLLIVGENQNPSYFTKCLDLIKNNQIKNIDFLGKKSQLEISELLASSRLLVMASSHEGLPRVLIESGLCATPSIATNIQGISSPFGTLGGTLLYEFNNANEFITQLKEFTDDESLQLDLQQKSYQLATKLSGKNSFGDNWSEIMKKLYE